MAYLVVDSAGWSLQQEYGSFLTKSLNQRIEQQMGKAEPGRGLPWAPAGVA
jgi:hypothetical protein